MTIEYKYNVNVLWMYMNVNDIVKLEMSKNEKDSPTIFLLS